MRRDEDQRMMSGFAVRGLGSLALAWCWWSLVHCSVATQANSLPGPTQGCEVARMKCAYRTNCAHSLHSYMVDCADVLAGRTTRCPWACKRALISLTSYEMGLALSNCDCGDNEFCKRSKERAEVCRPEVSHATADDTVVACSVAEWICAADPLCSTALEYYHRLCRPMFHGRKCTPRCNNSLAILDRQEKASKLRNCYCDGTEDFPCLDIKQNTQRLCYGREEFEDNSRYLPPSTSDTDSGSTSLAQSSGLLCLVLLVIVLWTFRTNVEVGSCTRPLRDSSTTLPSSDRRTVVKCTQQISSVSSKWPWWWTSEEFIKLDF